jgi:hypothetical protein
MYLKLMLLSEGAGKAPSDNCLLKAGFISNVV